MKIGVGLVVGGALGAGINQWAFNHYPDQWGGPNIGGGALQLLFYILLVVGVVRVVRALRRRRTAPGQAPEGA